MKWKDKRVLVTLGVVGVVILLIGFRIFQNLMADSEKASKSGGSSVVSVPFEKPKDMKIEPILTYSASVEPIWEANVAPKVSGRVEKIFVNEGDFVKEGAVLAKLDSTELSGASFAAKGNLIDAKAAESSAKLTLDRYEQLFKQGAISKKVLDDTRFAYDKAKGKTEAALGSYNTAKSRVEGTVLKAPHDGFIVKRLFREGHFATTSTALFSMADISTLLVKFNIPEGEVGLLSKGVRADINVPAFEDSAFSGKISKIAHVADLPARTFAAQIAINNSDYKLRGGVFGNVVLRGKIRDALTVPQSAIVMREDQRTVFVVDKNDKAIRKVLETGFVGDGIVEVLSGLKRDDRVVTGGQNKLREGRTVKVDKGGK